ncbi:hypothetical protein EUX98_g687 [Antrodiella citrinella]|uniref:Cytochrome P450 n=1 Tax=Antrodiella citrinella TaxID=2447956 RepID=A0A4S4N3A8_9APHY|nr:hypothetical protein EUX98_g687 [Antrodiella citrinella]
MFSTLDVLVCICALTSFFWLFIQRIARSSLRFRCREIPGPAGLPLIGNLWDIPTDFPWLVYKRMSNIHDSDIIRLNALGNNIVVINTIDIAMDLFEKRSSLYSDRPPMVMLTELVGAWWGIAFRRYGTGWRDTRKAFHLEFHPSAVKRFRPVEEQSTREFLQNLLVDPADFMVHIRHLAGTTIMKVSFGIDVKPRDDPFIEIGERAIEAVSATGNAGVYMVDMFPLCGYFVSSASAEQALIDRIWRKLVDAMYHTPYQIFRERWGDGWATDSAAASLMEKVDGITQDPVYAEEVMKSALGSMYAAGADTTVSATSSFFLAMVLYPEVQKKAQREVDKVLGGTRLPTFSDISSIPAMLHDEAMYPEPHKFDPDRHLKDGKINPAVRDPSAMAFGFGRRICPGRYMARESMWLTVASVLATMDIGMAIGEDGRPIVPDETYRQGMLCFPKPFRCTIVPRSKEHEDLILTSGTL